MSRPAAPRGGPRGPRQAPPPRSGDGARGTGGAREPGTAHRPRHARAPGYAAREVSALGTQVASPPATQAGAPRWRRPPWRRGERGATAEDPRRQRPPRVREVEPRPSGELSGLALLLDQLDALLRDPTLTRALQRFTSKIADGVRALARSLRLPRIRLRLPHLPRWLLLPLLALLAALIPLWLFWPDGDDRAGAGTTAASSEITLPGVGMPDLQAAPDDPPPARVALVVDNSYAPAALSRELQTLGAWIAANHAPQTRVVLIDAATGRASAPLSAAGMAGGAATQPASGTAAALRTAFAGNGGRRLLVSVGAPAPASSASTLTVATRRGAGAPTSIALRRGRRARVAIDARRPDALAASVARALIAISGQRERR